MFVKRSDEITKDGMTFSYLGSARVLKAEDVKMQDAKGNETYLVKFEIQLQNQVDYDLYTSLTE